MTTFDQQLHGARGLTAHEVLERRLRARERAEAFQRQIYEALASLACAAQRAVRGMVEACSRFLHSNPQVLDQLREMVARYRFASKPAKVRHANRASYWIEQRLRLERLQALGALSPHQKQRLQIAKANSYG